ncbi:hypothetical protein [Kerstersia gyiorum]|uniref:hypothetical protein n=1 Tax=Kerstersia gyiorum TaxID=206506 RepID=UPI00209CE0BE|nr:hypothetical protein [Kerstersia gyiorum]MCP1679424.1 hypothetical protein [Kerstersia gyiorum]MCP1823927.1 hypothetical protein [Kerstersia gyiorum]MCP1827368.1 hypothetical protein [Kerstersia gyiorum]MCW2448983.1 hypothetical protein [Kerstersia gyiorum]
MLLQDMIPRALFDRLTNWGECMRGGMPPPYESPTYRICADLARRAGQTRGLENDRVDDRDPVDAEIMEAAWRYSLGRMPEEQRRVVRDHFVRNRDWRSTCKQWAVPRRRYNDLVAGAALNFGQILEQYERLAISSRNAHNSFKQCDSHSKPAGAMTLTGV